MVQASDTAAGVGSRSRARLVLGVILILLILLLAALGVFFVRVLAPAGLFGLGGTDAGGIIWIRSMYGFGPAADEQLLGPSSVAVAPNGQIYVTDPQRSRVMVFNPGGSFARLLHTGMGGIGKGQFTRPEHVDVDEQGNVYVADSIADKIIVFDDAGDYVTEWPVPLTRGVTVRGEDVYVLSVGSVYAFKKDGTPVGQFGQRGKRPGDIDAYAGIVADDRSLYIADALNQRLERFDRTNADLVWAQPATRGGAILSAGSKDVSATAPYDLPQDLVFDNAGRLVVIDAFAFKLFVVDPDTGVIEASYGEVGEEDGLLFYPTGIDYDPARDWFAIADTRNNRVQLVRIPGTGGGAAAAVRRALTSPLRYCAVPLLLLLAAIVIFVISARRRLRTDEEPELLGEPEES